MKTIYLATLLLYYCTTQPTRFDKPKDYSEILHEVKESNELKQNPILQRKIVNTIQDQSNYLNSCYNELKILESSISMLKKENEDIRKQNEIFKDKLKTWNTIQLFFWLFGFIFFVSFVIKLLFPVIKPFFKFI